MPTLFLSHGPGPLFFAKESKSDNAVMNAVNESAPVTQWYKQIGKQLGTVEGGKYGKPKALVVISAHWETPNQVWITSKRDMGLFYDYYGFDKYLYDIKYPAKGDPDLANQIRELLKLNNIKAELDRSRSFDHGIFIPLKLIYPEANIPIVQISLREELSASDQLEIGKALQYLREEGVLIIGSGQLTHNFSTMEDKKVNHVFTSHLDTILTKSMDNEERMNQLLNWEAIPNARKAHAREEHFLPLLTVAGAANGCQATKLNDHWAAGMSMECYAFEN